MTSGTSGTTGPSWYDVLGVDRDASTDEIRTAWRSGIADLDPSNARFRSLNQAAEVLLDKKRRKTYDAQLPAATTDADPETEEAAAQTPPTRQFWGRGAQRGSPKTDGSAHSERDPQAATATEPRVDPSAGPPAGPPARGVSAWVLAPLALLTVVMVVVAAYLFTLPSDAAVASSTTEAQAAAERDMATVLSYDYRHMASDQKAAEALMTPEYAKKYDQVFAVLKTNAATIKPVVTAQVIASAIVRSGDNRVQILVFVNRPSTNAKRTTPQVSHDWVRVTMVKSGGDWLVDDLDTSPTPS